MIVKVEWSKPNSDGFKMYHTYECSEYFVEITGWSGSCGPGMKTESQPSNVRLMLDCNKHDICLSGGDVAYIMNNEGKTIDIVRT